MQEGQAKLMIINADEVVGAPAYKVNYKEAKDLAMYLGIRTDLLYVVQAAERLSALKNDLTDVTIDPLLTRSLWTGAIVAYGRCFALGKRGPLRMEQVFDGQEDYLKWHLRFMDLRNHHVAHSVDSYLEQNAVGIRIPDEEAWRVEALQALHNAPSVEVVNALNETGRFVLKWVGVKAQLATELVLNKAKCIGESQIKRSPLLEIHIGKWVNDPAADNPR